MPTGTEREVERRRRAAPAVVLAPPLVWLAVFFLIPVLLVAMYSVGALTLFPGDRYLSLDAWARFLSGDQVYLGLFWRSIRISLLVSTIAVVSAYPVAYYLALVAVRRRYVLLLLIIAPFLTSYLLRLLAWRVILGDQGIVNTFLYTIGLREPGHPVPWLLYSPFTVVVVLAYVWVPFVCLPIFVSLDSIDRSLLEAAADLGARRWSTFLRIVLPSSRSGLAAAFAFVFVPTIGEFVTPLLVGGPRGFMFGNAIADLFGPGLDWQTGSVLSLFLVLVVGALMAVFSRSFSVEHVAAIAEVGSAGRGAGETAASSGGRRILAVLYVLLVAFLYAPIAILVAFSFNSSPSVTFPLRGFTLEWYRAFLANGALVGALRTSALVAGLTSVVAVALGLPAAFALARRRSRGRGLVGGILLAPLVIPYLVLGIALLVLFNAVGVPLSPITIAIGHVVLALPFSVLVLAPRLGRIDRALEEAAMDLGASPLRVFARVTMPLLTPAVISAALIAFTLSFDEYAVASFLAGDQVTYPIYLFSQLRFPNRLPQVLAVSTLVLLGSLVLVTAVEVARARAERRLAAPVAVSEGVA
jgi:ABC-type spermidine/putrescine transport system permease subunit I